MSNVHDQRAGTTGFCMVYQDVISHPAFLNLPRAAILCYLYIGSHTGGVSGMDASPTARTGPTGKRWRLSIARIQAGLQMSRSGVFAALEKLTTAGLLTRKGTRTASWFSLHDPPGVGEARHQPKPAFQLSKHAKTGALGIREVEIVRDATTGLPVATVQGAARLVRLYEEFQGHAVSSSTWQVAGFQSEAYAGYLGACAARGVSTKLDPSEGSNFVDGGPCSETKPSNSLDPLETSVRDQPNSLDQSQSQNDVGLALDTLLEPIDNPALICCVAVGIRWLNIFPVDGRALSHFILSALVQAQQDLLLSAELDLALAETVARKTTALLASYNMTLADHPGDQRPRLFREFACLWWNTVFPASFDHADHCADFMDIACERWGFDLAGDGD